MKVITNPHRLPEVVSVPAESTEYRGCGYAWAALNERGELVALRYMEPRNLERQTVAAFNRRRKKAHQELAPMGRVVSGMLSCWDFIVNYDPANNPDLLNPERPLRLIGGGKKG